MIDGITVAVDEQAVAVIGDRPLAVVSSAPVGGGFSVARTLLNVHVGSRFERCDLVTAIAAFAHARTLPRPWVGFFTAAETDRAEVAVERVDDVVALAVVTVGLSQPIAAGWAAPAVTRAAGTINAIVIVDADLEPPALVNTVATVAEVKASILARVGVHAAERPATGTATDAVAVGATRRGPRYPFGGPCTVPGAAIARASHAALERGIRRWLATHR